MYKQAPKTNIFTLLLLLCVRSLLLRFAFIGDTSTELSSSQPLHDNTPRPVSGLFVWGGALCCGLGCPSILDCGMPARQETISHAHKSGVRDLVTHTASAESTENSIHTFLPYRSIHFKLMAGEHCLLTTCRPLTSNLSLRQTRLHTLTWSGAEALLGDICKLPIHL